MSIAYLDTSCVVALAFNEPASKALRKKLSRVHQFYSSNLLEAELKAALKREGLPIHQAFPFLSSICWIFPSRPLTEEIDRTLMAGTLRGADLWHVATALFLSPNPQDIIFFTLDSRQQAVVNTLGFLPL